MDWKKLIILLITVIFISGCTQETTDNNIISTSTQVCNSNSSCILEAAERCAQEEFFGEVPVVLEYTSVYTGNRGYKNVSVKIQGGTINSCETRIRFSGSRKDGYLGSLETKLTSPFFEQPMICIKTGEETKNLLSYYFQTKRFSSKLDLPEGCEYVDLEESEIGFGETVINGEAFYVWLYRFEGGDLHIALGNNVGQKLMLNSITLSGDVTGSCYPLSGETSYTCPKEFRGTQQSTLMITIDQQLNSGQVIDIIGTLNYDNLETGETGKTDTFKLLNVEFS